MTDWSMAGIYGSKTKFDLLPTLIHQLKFWKMKTFLLEGKHALRFTVAIIVADLVFLGILFLTH